MAKEDHSVSNATLFPHPFEALENANAFSKIVKDEIIHVVKMESGEYTFCSHEKDIQCAYCDDVKAGSATMVEKQISYPHSYKKGT